MLVCFVVSHNFHELAQKHNGPGPKKTSSLEIKESKSLGVYVKGLHEVVVEDENKILELMNQGSIYIFYFTIIYLLLNSVILGTDIY